MGGLLQERGWLAERWCLAEEGRASTEFQVFPKVQGSVH